MQTRTKPVEASAQEETMNMQNRMRSIGRRKLKSKGDAPASKTPDMPRRKCRIIPKKGLTPL
eukprot:1896676-Prorocentrum_lima.AAC.1